jgi:hypothetical protein
MEFVDAVANLDRVAGVGATLTAGDNVGVLCKYIDDLALEEELAWHNRVRGSCYVHDLFAVPQLCMGAESADKGNCMQTSH